MVMRLLLAQALSCKSNCWHSQITEHFLVATLTAAPSLADTFTNKRTHMTEESGGEETDCCYKSVGQVGALKCKKSQRGSWCPVHRDRSLRTLQWSQGEKPARHSHQGPLPPSGWAQSWVGWDGSPSSVTWRPFPPVFQQMAKVWVISLGCRPTVLTALYFQPFPAQLKVVKA